MLLNRDRWRSLSERESSLKHWNCWVSGLQSMARKSPLLQITASRGVMFVGVSLSLWRIAN
jgi:hypothetical protein